MLTAQQAIKVMRLLLVEPAESTASLLQQKFVEEGYERCFLARTGEEALRLLSTNLARHEPIDLVIMSLSLPDRPGLETFDEVRNVFDVALLLLADRSERHIAQEGVGRGADDY